MLRSQRGVSSLWKIPSQSESWSQTGVHSPGGISNGSKASTHKLLPVFLWRLLPVNSLLFRLFFLLVPFLCSIAHISHDFASLQPKFPKWPLCHIMHCVSILKPYWRMACRVPPTIIQEENVTFFLPNWLKCLSGVSVSCWFESNWLLKNLQIRIIKHDCLAKHKISCHLSKITWTANSNTNHLLLFFLVLPCAEWSVVLCHLQLPTCFSNTNVPRNGELYLRHFFNDAWGSQRKENTTHPDLWFEADFFFSKNDAAQLSSGTKSAGNITLLWSAPRCLPAAFRRSDWFQKSFCSNTKPLMSSIPTSFLGFFVFL